MKACMLLLCSLFINLCSSAQIVDSTRMVHYRSFLSVNNDTTSTKGWSSIFQKSEGWRILRYRDVLYKSHYAQLPVIEREILNLESSECAAVRKRDTMALIRIWARDFTLDKKSNQVITDKAGLPYCTALSRMIESIISIDEDTVFTRGYEMFQEFDALHYQPLTKRPYFHTWTRINGRWKLTTKTHEP